MTRTTRLWSGSMLALCGLTLGVGGCGPTGHAGAEPPVVLDADARGLPETLECLQDKGVTLVSAHRGGPAPGYPENAISSFERIVQTAPALIETDVRMTADGVLVLLHDRDLDRTTTCVGSLQETAMRSLRGCRLRDNDGRTIDEGVPTLVEALAWAQDRAILQLDVKRRGDFPAVVDLVKQADAFDRVVFITYSPNTAVDVADLHPEAVISTTIEAIEEVDALAQDGLGPERLIAWVGFGEERPELVAALNARGVMANFGTLGFGDSLDDQIAASGDGSRYADIALTGVDVIATDRPLAAYAALQAAHEATNDITACTTL